MKANLVKVRGEDRWMVLLGMKLVGKRVRVFGGTKERALARAQEKLDELREHGHAQSGISSTHRSIIIEWRERLTPQQMVEAFVAFENARCHTRTVKACVAD